MASSPATVLTSSTLAHLHQIYHRATALETLQKKCRFHEPCTKFELPKNGGRTVQMFRYNNLAASTTPTTEGTIGSGLSISSNIVQATVSQFTNFIPLSDLVLDTAPDDLVAAASRLLGYRGGLSVDTMTRAIVDVEQPSIAQTVGATYLKVSDLRSARHKLQASDVHPFANGMFKVLLSPYSSYDVVNDSAAGGLADILKYNTNVKDSPLVRYEDRGKVTEVAGCEVVETTNVWSSGSTFRTYIFGEGAVGVVDLAGRGPNRSNDPGSNAFNLMVNKGSKGSIYDPEGVIGATVAYNFVTASVVLEGPAGIGGTWRMKTIDAASSIA